jgi:hypothetical protein
MKKIILTISLFLAFADGFSQIKSGERLVFSGSYNMSGILTPLAQITMSTGTTTTAKGSYLHLSCEAATYSKWDSFFKIRDIYESYVNPTSLTPSLYKRSITEGGYVKTEKYVIKGNSIVSTAKKGKKPETIRTFTIGGNTQDIVSTIYKMRTLDFANMKAGQTKSFTVVFDEEELPVVVKYMGTETVSAGNLGSKLCYKISIAAKTNALKGTDKNLMWLTADGNKVPVLIKFSIKVGVGQLTLTSATGV